MFHLKKILGRNYFNQLMKRYYFHAGLDSEEKRLSLRSLRATVSTRPNQEGVDDNVIMQRTGVRR